MTTLGTAAKPLIHYPDSDGEPVADNTTQYRWIATLKWNADAQFRGDPNIFVAGDNLIYPVEGDPKTRQAPDVYVAFGPAKHDRGSYRVWEENGIFPQVVVEVWSPNNRYGLMQRKLDFYERYGAEEYYILYPEFPAYVEAWRRHDNRFVEITDLENWISPRLGWKFLFQLGELVVLGIDGKPLRDPVEIIAELEATTAQRDAANAQRDAANAQRDAERERAAKLAAKLRELGLDPDAV